MSERLTFTLHNLQQGFKAVTDAWQWAKPYIAAGHRLVLSLRLENRTDLQNNLLHSRISDVSKHCIWAGEKLDIEDWKRLLTAAWCRANAEGVRILPAIDGQGFDVLYRRTSKLSRRECVDLSDFIMAWGSEKQVPWCLASLGRELSNQ
jgi:hypothetical protein